MKLRYLITILAIVLIIGCAPPKQTVTQPEVPVAEVVEKTALVVEEAPVVEETEEIEEPTTPTGAVVAEVTTTEVMIGSSGFDPATLTVPTGTTVTWTNARNTVAVLKEESKEFTSSRIAPAGSFEHTFEEAGTYEYFNSVVPRMRGTIIVE